MKIANKISLSFFVAVLILMTIAGTIFYLTAKDSLQKSIYNNLTAVLASRSSHIETYLKMLETSVGQLSRSATLEDFLKISDKESPERNDAFLAEMKRLARIKEANPAIAEFLLMDKRGLAAASSNKSSVGLDKSADPIFLIGQKEIYIKDVYFSEVYKEPLMAVSAPIIDNVTGELSGVLAARVRLNDLNDIVANRTGKGETGEIYIVNERGYMITPSRFDKGTVLKQKVDSEAVRHALLHKDRAHVLPNDKFVDIYPDYRGVPTLGAHEYIPRMRWTVIAEIDAKEAFRPLAMIRLIFILILFIVPIAGWLLGMFIAGTIIRPLQKLRKGAEIIGSGNLDYKVGTAAKDEVGQLSRAFDSMLEALKNSVAAIKNLNKEITERKKAEESLRESEAKYRTLFTGAPEGMLVFLAQAKQFLYCNPAICRMFGYTEEELMRLSAHDIYPKEALGRALAEFEALARMEKRSAEVLCLRKDGTVFDVSISLSNIVIDGFECILGFFTNITERRKAEEELKLAYKKLKQIQQELIQASKMAAMGQLAAGVSHELNQPLTGIKGFAQAVLMDLEKNSPFKDDLNKIVAQVDRMDTIIKNVRFFARKSDFNMVELDINQIILNSLMLRSFSASLTSSWLHN